MNDSERFKDESISKLYAKYRTICPPHVVDAILDFLGKKIEPPYKHAIDVGCGTGVSTLPLAQHFDNVTGCDISETQIKQANQNLDKPDHVDYKISSFKKLPAEDSSVDLVTCGNAAHWFEPIEDFYSEVNRVLRPGGCLCVYGFSNVRFTGHDNSKDMDLIVKAVYEDDRLQQYRSEKNAPWEGCQEVLKKSPYTDCNIRSDLYLDENMTFGTYLGRLRSLSWIHPYIIQHPNETNPVEEARQKFKKYLGNEKLDDVLISTRSVVFMSLGRKGK